MSERLGPPRLASAWIERRLPPELREAVLGDLESEYRERVRPALGRARADAWFWYQALTLHAWALRREARALRMHRPRSDAPIEGARDAGVAAWVGALRRDVRYSLRRLLKTPGFTAVAVLSLALGIGANTAMFSLVNAVLLRGAPVEDPETLVEVYTSDQGGFAYSVSSFPDYVDLRTRARSFSDVVATRTMMVRVGIGDASRLAIGELVSWDYFAALGIPMALGRSFRPDEGATPGTHPVVILGHRVWQEDFAGDSAVVGSTVHLSQRPFTVVGVADPDFRGSLPVMLAGYFVPLQMTDVLFAAGSSGQLERRGSRSLFVKARLAPGVTLDAANAELAAISSALSEAHPESNDERVMTSLASGDVSLHPLVDGVLGPVAVLLLGVVGIVLMIACANLASFLLARAEDRGREIAVRLALGAGRSGLVRQLLIETTLLAAMGGLVGLALADWTLGLLMAFRPPLPLPIDFDVSLDGTVLVFTAAVSLAAGLAFGLVPALQATRPDLAPTLKGTGGVLGGGRSRMRDALVVTQVTLSFVLLIGAGLFARSLQKAQRIDPGFDTGPGAVLWPDTDLTGAMNEEERRAFFGELRARLLEDPGVTAVALADRLPLGAEIQTGRYLLPDRPSQQSDGGYDIDQARVTPSYFEAMDVAIVRGSGFTEADENADPVAIVSEAFVERFYPGRDVIGATVETMGGQTLRIVGVAADTKVRTLGEAPRPYIYRHMGQGGYNTVQVLVRGSVPEGRLLTSSVATLREIDPDVPLIQSKTMQEHLALLLFPPRMAALLLSAFGGLALLLAGIGVYGVVSYAVSARTRELGIRMSLGASTADVIRIAVGGGMRLVVLGAALGIVLAGGLAWAVSGYLFGIGPNDLVTFLAIPLLLGVVALLAAWLPARRAAGVDPVRALRAE